jgi:hypothetical protein
MGIYSARNEAILPDEHPALKDTSIFMHSISRPSISLLLITVGKFQELAWLHLLCQLVRDSGNEFAEYQGGDFLSEENTGKYLFLTDVGKSHYKRLIPSK